jgi:hypothetical protein
MLQIPRSASAKMHLWPEEPFDDDGGTTYSATIELGRAFRKKLWYKVPAQWSSFVTDSCDPLLLGMIFIAAEHRANIEVHGRISPSLLRNVIDFQNAWQAWLPQQFASIEINADKEAEDEPAQSSGLAICAYSGGVDSSFTIYRHQLYSIGRQKRNIDSALLASGFDFSLDKDETFARRAASAESLLNGIGLNLITMQTNFRELNSHWIYTHGAALASSLMLFKRQFTEGIIAGTYDYNRLLLPWGSNPVTDHLLSSNSFQIIHDAPHWSRGGKLGALKNWPAAYDQGKHCPSPRVRNDAPDLL